MSSLAQQLPPRLGQRTPLDWRDLLLGRLAIQREQSAIYEAYYEGQHPLAFATQKFREAFGTLLGAFADNWCQVIVDSSVERLRVVGFEVAGATSSEAWEIWQRNGLDVESDVAHTEAGKSGCAYLLVDPNDGEPLITVEHSSQVVVVNDPQSRRRRLAALKQWLGDDGYQYATLYLPDVVLRYQTSEPVSSGSSASVEVEWVPRDDAPSEVANPFGVVPVIPLENKPGLLGQPHSDLQPAIPIQNAINKLCSDLLVASEYGAFPQRVITGWESPLDPETGRPMFSSSDRRNWLEAAMSRVWTFSNADVKTSSLPAADLANFTTALEVFVQHMAAQTKTPPHYLLGQVVNASGDALSVAEAGLVSKCRGKIKVFSDGWEEALALALGVVGVDTTSADCETVWANPERVTLGVLVDAAVKKRTLGIPLPVIWLELGYTPAQIEQMTLLETSRREAELEAAAQAESAAAREMLTKQPGEAVPPGEPAPAAPAPAVRRAGRTRAGRARARRTTDDRRDRWLIHRPPTPAQRAWSPLPTRAWSPLGARPPRARCPRAANGSTRRPTSASSGASRPACVPSSPRPRRRSPSTPRPASRSSRSSPSERARPRRERARRSSGSCASKSRPRPSSTSLRCSSCRARLARSWSTGPPSSRSCSGTRAVRPPPASTAGRDNPRRPRRARRRRSTTLGSCARWGGESR